jgi:hypothetical protein
VASRMQRAPKAKRGRPPLAPEEARRNRVVVMLTDGELAKLHRLAEEKTLPLGTVAYEFVARGLARR